MKPLQTPWHFRGVAQKRLFPKKRGILLGIPMATIVVKIDARVITVDVVPTTADVVILVKRSHKPYPVIAEIILSIYIYTAPFPTSFLWDSVIITLTPIK